MTAFFTDHYPECPLYSSQWEAADSGALSAEEKDVQKGGFSQRDFGRIYWNVNITDFRGSSCNIKISVWYLSDSEIGKAVFILIP